MATYDETEPDDILLDSAATCHMFQHHKSFTNYRPPPKTRLSRLGTDTLSKLPDEEP
jgi:hypothetical protein